MHTEVIVISIGAEKEKAEKEELDAEQARRNAEQGKLNSAFIEWDSRLASCCGAIEKNAGFLSDPDDLYKPIWEMEKIQPEPRYKDAFDQRLARHISWLRSWIDYGLLDG